MDGVPDEVLAHYATGIEAERLAGPRLERLRTEELLLRFLPAPPARIIDIGGGPGRYAAWLAGLGYEVDLFDPVPLHVDQASQVGTIAAALGDARSLPAVDDMYDVALVMGPLYHLTERDDRVQALREARRVTRPGAVVMAAAISRFASLLDGLGHGFLADGRFQAIVREDLRTGQHRNPTDQPGWFTTAYFHAVDELESEMIDAGLIEVEVLGIEGPAWYLANIEDRLANEDQRELVLMAARWVESEPELKAASAHLLAIGRSS